MKKRLIGAAIAAVVLMTLFAACGDDVQTIAYDEAEQVGDITVTQIAKNYYVVISWDAVEDGTGYSVYAQQEGKKTVINLGSGNNSNTYSNYSPETENVKSTPNSDIDKWVKVVDVKYNKIDVYGESSYITPQGSFPSGSFRFGVQTNTLLPNHEDSEIKWSDYITITAPADKTITH